MLGCRLQGAVLDAPLRLRRSLLLSPPPCPSVSLRETQHTTPSHPDNQPQAAHRTAVPGLLSLAPNCSGTSGRQRHRNGRWQPLSATTNRPGRGLDCLGAAPATHRQPAFPFTPTIAIAHGATGTRRWPNVSGHLLQTITHPLRQTPTGSRTAAMASRTHSRSRTSA